MACGRARASVGRCRADGPQAKYQNAIAEHNKYHAEMDREMSVVREQQRRYKESMRDMEVNNDELENAERCVCHTRRTAPR